MKSFGCLLNGILYLTVICIALNSVVLAQNLLVNGDFESGNVGFMSEYTFAPSLNTTEGEYTVRSDPSGWNHNFTATPDHTSGSGNMLVLNGATTGNQYLWQQIVTVSPSTSYRFSAWVSTAVAGGPSDLIVKINGLQLGQVYTAPSLPGPWGRWIVDWYSDVSTVAEIRIYNLDTSKYPNDFYIDDISFSISSGQCPIADLTGDCFVDLEDLAIMAQQWLTGIR